MSKKKTSSKSVAKKMEDATREILYPKPHVTICGDDSSLTAEQAKELLGWEEETDEKFGEEYLIKDSRGKKIRCHNNINNRPFVASNCAALRQEILRGHWRLNFVNRIIGRTGLVVNGQHTLVALILASQEWEINSDKYPFWETEPTLETSIAFGAAEDNETINTIDTGKPRSLADVLFRSARFAEYTKKDRKQICRILDYAIRFLWDRTGVANAYAIRRTHSESIEFLDRHPRLLECVEHTFVEEAGQDKKLSRYVALGSAAGLLYLMGSARSVARSYHQSDNPREQLLDWQLWDKALDFWTLLAGHSNELRPIAVALGYLINTSDTNHISHAEKVATLLHGWVAFLSGKPLVAPQLKLKYHTDQDGVRTLAECPLAGGIDLGNGEYQGEPTPQDPTLEEIEQRATEQRTNRATKKKPTKKSVKKSAKKSAKKKATPKKLTTKKSAKKLAKKSAKKKPTKKARYRIGQIGWLETPGQEPRQVKMLEVLGSSGKAVTLNGFAGAGSVEKIALDRLLPNQPAKSKG